MTPSNSQPPDFQAIYFDTNALIGAGWPDPSVLLHNVAVIGKWWGIQMFIPEPVVKEAEQHWFRKVKEQVTRVESATRELERIARPAACEAKTEHPSIEMLHQQYAAKRDEVVTQYEIAIPPFTKRPVEDLFELATKYIMPFEYDKKGMGFQDAVILASILEHLSTQLNLKAVFVTKDGAFGKSNYHHFIAGFDHSRLRIDDLESVWNKLFDPYFDETVLKPWHEERRNALAAANALAPEFKNFLTTHLSESMLKTTLLFDTAVKLLSVDAVHVNSVDTPIPEKAQSDDRKVEFTVAVSAYCRAVVRKNFLFTTLWGISKEDVPTMPAVVEEVEEQTSWSGGIRATADVVNRQFQNIVPQSVVSEEELRTKH